MAHPVIWSPRMHFYPIGNTPATSLVEYIPPDEDATILVLGCGDPRTCDRALDFTFCDSEPAVLARNVLFYATLYDQCDEKTINCVWKIYFDIFVDKKSFDLLVSYCQKLVDLSNNLESWKTHPYSAFIKFCTADTLATLRRYWELYIFKGRSPTALKQAVQKEMKVVSSQFEGVVTTSLRSAGIMSTRLVDSGPAHYTHYWENGVADVEPSEISSATHVNPTLLYSSNGDSLHLHYGTDPILCFHLAPALAPVENNPNSPATDIAGIMKAVHSQFRDWCQNFNKRANSKSSKGKMTLRFFSGNAMSLCKALRRTSQTGSLDTPEYTNHYGASTISFVEDYLPTSSSRAPINFNIIETSNLSDHLGFLNILLIAAPLLKRDACSVLFTHSLVGSKGREGRHSSALEKLGVDLPFLSLLFGLVPERAVSETTSQSISHELMISLISGDENQQLFEFNHWRVSSAKVPGMAYTFSCDPLPLARSLFSTYLELFADEAIGGPRTIKHYTRDTFISLLSFIKDAYSGPWDDVSSLLVTLIEKDRSLIVGLNYYQDLCRALHLAGLCDIMPSPKAFPPTSRNYCFEGWDDIPNAICVVLVVPRKNIQTLLDDSKRLKTPPLQCEVLIPGGHNAFTSFQPSFGTIKEVSPSPNKKVVIHEDPTGWAGRSDLIVHFLAPAWLFVQRPLREYNIGLNMHGPSAMVDFVSKLGLTLSIYSTTLADSKRAFILRDRPRIKVVAQEVKPLSALPASPILSGTVVQQQQVGVEFQGEKPSAFTIRSAVTDDLAKATLGEKSTKVEVKALSTTAVQVSFEGFTSTLHFPYPVETSALVTRIARKSSYVEVEGRIARVAKVPVNLHPFPVVLAEKGPCALRMHYLNLDSLPAFRSPIPAKEDISWLKQHFLLSVGQEKKDTQRLGQKQSGLLELKDSITSMLQRFFQDFNGEPCVIHLADKEQGVYVVLFISCVRIDTTAHTVVADASVLPLTLDLVLQPSIQKALASLQGTFPMAKTATTPEEVSWWKAYIPTTVERCRTWKHTKNCEYIAEGIPRSLEIAKDPICTCGRGKDLGKFSEVNEWSAFKPYVTRAAIALPFSTSLLSDMASDLRAGMTGAKQKKAGGGGNVCAACGQPGKPRLLLCARCKNVQYCSAGCQKADWRMHKKECHN